MYLQTIIINLLLKLCLFALELPMRIVQNLNHFLDFILVLLHLEQPAVDVVLLPLQELLTTLLLMGNRRLQQTDLLLVAKIELFNGSRQLLLVCL
jgi:hypothetical protein